MSGSVLVFEQPCRVCGGYVLAASGHWYQFVTRDGFVEYECRPCWDARPEQERYALGGLPPTADEEETP